jgi:hypothetical protein
MMQIWEYSKWYDGFISKKLLLTHSLQTIIPNGTNMVNLEAALLEVWRQIVQKIAGEHVQPVSLEFDWPVFWEEVGYAIGRTGRRRWSRWYHALKRRADEDLDDASAPPKKRQ